MERAALWTSLLAAGGDFEAETRALLAQARRAARARQREAR